MVLTALPSRRLSLAPLSLTPLIGRQSEARDVESLLRNSGHRLLTLTGPGGVGKTRLALHLAARLDDDFQDGVAFIPLAPIHDPDLVLPTIAQALGLHDGSSLEPEDERLIQHLHGRHLLLVLDNFEQVLSSAPYIVRLLTFCPEIKALITSRAPLGVEGEQQVPLTPLPVPASDATTSAAIQNVGAVTLFVQRAQAVSPEFSLSDENAPMIAGICQKLDGLPLAIELAAARMNILSPASLLARLGNRLQILTGARRDVPDRLRTMRQAIAWSYELLSPDEQRLFRRLSVFAGGIPIEAVDAIFVPSDTASGLDLVGRLVNHSLVRALPMPDGESRFLMLETLRDYGLEQLQMHGEEEEARAAHAAYFCTLTEQADAVLTGADQQLWYMRYQVEIDNIRAMLEWLLSAGDREVALRICGNFWRFWSVRGLVNEGRAWFARVLAAEVETRSVAYASALHGAGILAQDQNELETAMTLLTRSFELAGELGDVTGQIRAAIGLGSIAHDRGEYARALAFHGQAAELSHAIGNKRGVAMALGSQAAVFYFQGNYEQAETNWFETRRILHDLGDYQAEASVASNLGGMALDRGQLARAEELLTETLELQRGLGDSWGMAYTLSNLGDLWRQRQDSAQAEVFLTQSIALFRQGGDLHHEAITNVTYGELLMDSGDDSKAAEVFAQSAQALCEVGDQRSMAIAMTRLAMLAARYCPAEAAELYGASAHIREQLDVQPVERMQEALVEASSLCERALGKDAFDAALQSGAELAIVDAVQRMPGIAHLIATRVAESGACTPRSKPSETDNPLTEREMDVLRLLAEGQSSAEIAESLFISPRTATTHVTHILTKLDVTSRAAAVASAIRRGLV